MFYKSIKQVFGTNIFVLAVYLQYSNPVRNIPYNFPSQNISFTLKKKSITQKNQYFFFYKNFLFKSALLYGQLIYFLHLSGQDIFSTKFGDRKLRERKNIKLSDCSLSEVSL